MYMEKVNINETIDNAKFSLFHWKVLVWCLLIIIFDGYDLVIYGVALPLLMQQWSLTAVQAGLLASAALFGMMFGAMIFGTLSDRLGRKKTIMICVTLFSGFTFLGAFATNPVEFAILRFIAGLGIGGVMPNVVALMTEYAPKKIRSTLVAIMFSGYAIGGMTSALLGAWLVKDMGWQIMFLIAGIPLLMLPIIWKFLPESLAFLIKSGKEEQAKQIINKLLPTRDIHQNTQLVFNENIHHEAPVKALFQDGRAFSTFMFWIAFFMCLLMVYALGSWLPKLMLQAGYSLGASMLFLFALNIGGMVGAIGGGALADRFHLKPVITSMFVIGAAALILLGFNSPQIVLYSLIALAGAATIGSQILLYTFVAQFYPTTVRSTGMGWASGIGRIGAIIGPVLTGALLTFELPHQMNFLAIAIPGVIAAFAIFLVNLKVAVNVPESSKSTLQTQASVNQQ
ncbi:aromatic acid/H+ symport family MFS transporter [Acinetobacter junii]|jgi:AAHS family benzoate transporter-like MFS transporter|uniref:Aromatic acid/H+ symport family MFS transporter n=1 Tax=Acinetobacter junii TaxID=40215 RepID=A0A365PIJ4_ACIJU|nr:MULTISPECIES: aromatic acid/H+ symport family MFS transporter [Acinetobacter]ATU45399.1 aromatic acid/H+ symport family MFS transporter [Acinetobacter junii]MBF4455883.1 aromatic acid/H+ symport family MFS transporter [Acinetobacter sp. SK-43]MDH1914998.1 aromatic acid/H+ symport family MFS transporter [Acinetobacter junii]RBA37990.1 aromatic acid/H+ symport family MFS transporter [Acinetobacter junii]RBA42015.1 aromatic acid/H+ symport family MFS transporter [Acinetobacter junii]